MQNRIWGSWSGSTRKLVVLWGIMPCCLHHGYGCFWLFTLVKCTSVHGATTGRTTILINFPVLEIFLLLWILVKLFPLFVCYNFDGRIYKFFSRKLFIEMFPWLYSPFYRNLVYFLSCFGVLLNFIVGANITFNFIAGTYNVHVLMSYVLIYKIHNHLTIEVNTSCVIKGFVFHWIILLFVPGYLFDDVLLIPFLRIK